MSAQQEMAELKHVLQILQKCQYTVWMPEMIGSYNPNTKGQGDSTLTVYISVTHSFI